MDQKLKRETYRLLISEMESLAVQEAGLIGCMAHAAALLKSHFDFFWSGFYIVHGDVLRIGPYQGPVACTSIHRGKGVCGRAWEQKRTLIVDDVHAFEGHIACHADSKSEIVLPGFDTGGQVRFVLDIDSDRIAAFDQNDACCLEQLMRILERKL